MSAVKQSRCPLRWWNSLGGGLPHRLAAHRFPVIRIGTAKAAGRRFRTLKLHRAAHPRLRTDCLGPIGKGRNKAEVFADMLLADPSNRDHPAGRERRGNSIRQSVSISLPCPGRENPRVDRLCSASLGSASRTWFTTLPTAGIGVL